MVFYAHILIKMLESKTINLMFFLIFILNKLKLRVLKILIIMLLPKFSNDIMSLYNFNENFKKWDVL